MIYNLAINVFIICLDSHNILCGVLYIERAAAYTQRPGLFAN